MRLPILLFLILSLYSCDPLTNPGADREVIGLTPIYVVFDEANITTDPPRKFEDLGGIVSLGNYILIVEEYEGIHVINNTDPQNPVSEYFWGIPGIDQFTVTDNVLYAIFSNDIIVIDINDFGEIKFLQFIENVFSESQNAFPQDYIGSFECVDFSKGAVIRWDVVELFDPKCWR